MHFREPSRPHPASAHTTLLFQDLSKLPFLFTLPHVDTDTTHNNAMVNQDSSMPGELVARVFMRKKGGQKQRASDEPMLFTVDLLRPLFHLPIKTAALHVNLCPTALKSVCRKLGMLRWPYKQFQKASQLSSSLATESECSSPPRSSPLPSDPQPDFAALLLEQPCFDELLLELPLPGEDASDAHALAENHFLLPRSKRASLCHDFAPFSASSSCPPPDWAVTADQKPFAHALTPPMQESTSLALTFGWEPELERVARMHEHLFPSLYMAFSQDKLDPPRGHDLSFLSAGLEYVDCQG